MFYKKYFLLIPVVVFALAGVFAFASAEVHGEASTQADQLAEELVELDEDITAEDLNINDPIILPNNPLYILKGATRGIQSLITRDPVKKAELKLRFASEKIIEAKKMEERGAGDDTIRRAVESYERDVEQARRSIDRMIERGDEQIERITDRVIDNQIKHQRLLGKFMRKRDAIAPEIEKAKQEAMRHFTEAAASAVDPETLRQKFEDAMSNQKGSAFRQFKNIEMLREVKDFVPEQAKDAIQNAIESSSKFFEEEFTAIGKEQRELFNKYMEKTGGNEVRHLEAFDSINAFADIEKDMFEEMERAREKTRRRIEERMRTIEDETRKEVFLVHLEEAELEDVRIIKELENNLAPETITTILDIKHKMDQRMRERFEQAESVDDLDSFFKEIEKSPDVQMMEVMKEMEAVIPEDKKEFWEEMKKKAMAEMQEDIAQAQRFGRLEDQFRQMSGFDPEHMGVLSEFEDEFGGQFDFFDDMRREQAGRIEGRFEHFREFAGEGGEARFGSEDFLKKAEEFRLRIQDDPRAHEQIRQFAPQINDQFREFDVQREKIGEGFSEEEVRAKIQEAGKLVQNLAGKLVQAKDSNPGKNAARQLYTNASSQIADSQAALSRNKKGEAFGKATSAIHTANNGLRKLEGAAFEEERKEYFKERDEFRIKFQDLPKDERPDPSQFIEFKPTSFPGFEFPAPIQFQKLREETSGEHRFEEPRVCGQALTPARNIRTGACITFPNTCIPDGWEVVRICEEKSEATPIQHPPLEESVTPTPIHEERTFDFPKIDIPFFQEEPTVEAVPVPIKTIEPIFPKIDIPFFQKEPIVEPVPQTTTNEQKFLDEQKLLEEQRLLEQKRLDEQRLLDEQKTLEPIIQEIVPVPTTTESTPTPSPTPSSTTESSSYSY